MQMAALLIHKTLESTPTIHEAKWHGHKFKNSKCGYNGSLLNIIIIHDLSIFAYSAFAADNLSGSKRRGLLNTGGPSVWTKCLTP